LNEIAQAAELRILLQERIIPVRDDVHAACEVLGLDPLLVACEGRFVAFVPPHDATRALSILNDGQAGAAAVCIGEVCGELPPVVALQTVLGSSRILDMPSGEQLPRIC
jgi:hydrogenase expression/formation protein HypE